jgi:hypothetical protein
MSPVTTANNSPDIERGPQNSEIQLYNRVVAAAELGAILMTMSHSEVSPNAQTRSGSSEEEPVTRVVHIGHSVDAHSFDSEQGMASCVVSFRLRILAGASQEELFKTTCDFSVVYRGLEDHTSEVIRRFVDRVARFAAYPYFRAYVSHLVSLAEIEMPPLPILKESARN